MAQPLPDTWAYEVLRKGDLEGFERRISQGLGVSERLFSSFEERLVSVDARIGRRLVRTFLMVNIPTVLAGFLLTLAAAKLLGP